MPPGGLNHATNLPATNAAAGGGGERLVRRNKTPWWDDSEVNLREPETLAEPISLRLFVLLLLTACCYGLQLLAQRQRQAFEEEQEFAVREAQLRSAGRFAAEFTHQIKNPLAIINNAVFSIQRALKEGRSDVSAQIEIIQEEVERSDRIVTQIMGYAQLTEGHVEKLNVTEELDRAIEQVFPAAMESGIHVERNYGPEFPPLLMQRRHLSDSFVNLLQNAREALNGPGRVSVSAVQHPDSSMEITVQDNGPGIPADKLGRIFEAYYTTREKGTGLGLAIVKHNVELYAGTVRIESELGKGARFILTFPARTVIGLAKSK
jgi:signal transduction histidine kinase